jgi:hypothetical protein
MRRSLTASFALLMTLSFTGAAATAQSEAVPNPSADASATPTTPAQPAADPTITLDVPKWKKITPARSPAAREDHTWTVDADGRYAYLFGGRDGGKDYADLWRYDLETDTWKKLTPDGKSPAARFGHSAVWAEGYGLVVFAGQKGVEFFGDLWAFDPDTGKWRELPASGAAPKRRYGSCMIVGRDGRLWISHGFTFAGRFDDTRAYNLKTGRWASIAPDGRRPGERCLHDCFTTTAGDLVLYGGQDNSNAALGDLWLMRSNGTWKRQADPKAADRRLYAVTEAGAYAYVFGGAGKDGGSLDDFWRVDRDTLEWERVRVDGSGPAARYAATLITDSVRDRVLLFGGQGSTAKADVWELTDRVVPQAPEAVAAESSAAPASSAVPAASADPEG